MAQDSQADVESLNAIVDRIRAHLPDMPYLPDIPQIDAHFHSNLHHWEATRAWRGSVPFARNEQPELQYQTYYEYGIDLAPSPPPSPMPAKPLDSAPVRQDIRKVPAPKKKISLADYQKHKTQDPLASQRTPYANGLDSGSGARSRSQHGHDSKAGPEVQDFAGSGSPASLKRKRYRSTPRHISNNADSQRRSPILETTTPNTKNAYRADARDDPDPSPSILQQKRSSLHDEDFHRFKLPQPLSPLHDPMPGRLSPLGSLLPDILSPGLPPIIVEALDKRARQRTESDASKSSNGRPSRSVAKHDSVVNDLDAVSRKQDQRSRRRSASSDHREAYPAFAGLSTKAAEPKQGSQKHAPSSHSIVVLKIPRRLRQDFRRLLQFPPRPSIRADNIEVRIDGQNAARNHESQRRSQSPLPRKPFKLANPTTSASTPTESALPSATSSAKKLSASAMTRVASTDSHVHTPLPKDSTPLQVHKHSPSSTVTSADHKSTPQSEAWAAEAARLMALGKTLKTAATAHLQSSNREVGVLTHIEALCAFMLSFHASDRSNAATRPPNLRPPARNTWLSLHGFWRFVWANAEPWPALKGIVGGLGAVYLGKVCRWASSASDGAARDKEAAEAARLLGRIVAFDAHPGFGVAELKRNWPLTWRRLIAEDGGDEVQDTPGKYAGPIELPFTLHMSALKAVRAALALVAEWKIDGGKGRRFEPTLRLV